MSRYILYILCLLGNKCFVSWGDPSGFPLQLARSNAKFWFGLLASMICGVSLFLRYCLLFGIYYLVFSYPSTFYGIWE